MKIKICGQRCGAVVMASLLACRALYAGGPTTAPSVSPEEQVQYQQKTVEAQMQELQERMYHLAELTRDTEPDDSSRLLMAVRKAREDLIIEQMRDAIDQLGRQDLVNASDEQTKILEKLEELKKLLTTTDLDWQMQLDKLKKLNESIKKLDAGIKEERRETKQSDDAAKKPDGAPKPNAMQKEQQQNRRATEAVAQTVKDLGGESAKAADTLGTASQNMSLAEGSLGSGQPRDASPLQARAAENMQAARDQLEKDRQKLLEELEKQVRRQVVENLQEMLDRQKSIRGATEAAGSHVSGATDAVLANRVRKLAPAEAAVVRIADQTIELIETTDFSAALPSALKDIRNEMSSVGDRLENAHADTGTVSDEKHIERDLKDLLDTFKQLDGEPGPAGNCHGCKGNKNKLLAELKVLRLLQTRVNRETASIDSNPQGMGPTVAVDHSDPQVQAKIAEVHDRQHDVRTAVERIEQELSQ